MQTPPSTTLSMPSPTTQEPNDPTSSPIPPTTDTLPQPSMSKLPKSIHLIVATSISPPLGIGLKGSLPWPQIRTDMAFFRKATSTTTSSPSPPKFNAVIMGRKTWDSIPAKFRPLPGRVNVVLTRGDAEAVYEMGGRMGDEYASRSSLSSDQIRRSFDRSDAEGALFTVGEKGSEAIIQVTNSVRRAVRVGERKEVGRVFCIGGAEIYGMMLRDGEIRRRVRVLQTEVRKVDGTGFECDTFFPERLEEGGDTGWKKISPEDVKGWVRTELPQGESEEWVRDEKTDVEIRVIGWQAS